MSGTAYWQGWDIARGIVLMPGSTATTYSGFVLDGWGGLHAFAASGTAMPSPPTVTGYWPGWDIARGITLVPHQPGGQPQGYVLDGFGSMHPFNGAPNVGLPNYAGQDIVRGIGSG